MDRVCDHIDCDIILWSRSPTPIHSLHLYYNPHWPDFYAKVLNSNFQELKFENLLVHSGNTLVSEIFDWCWKRKKFQQIGYVLSDRCSVFLAVTLLVKYKKDWSAVNNGGFVCVLTACSCEVGTFPSIIWCVSVPKHQANSSEAFRVWELIIYTSKEFGKGCLYYWRHSLQ